MGWGPGLPPGVGESTPSGHGRSWARPLGLRSGVLGAASGRVGSLLNPAFLWLFVKAAVCL